MRGQDRCKKLLWGFFCIPILFLTGDVLAENEMQKITSPMKVTSDAFKDGELIPAEHTCDGKNISPLLRWKGAPAGTQSFAVLADDPDAPGGDWVHWVLYDLPPTVDMLPGGLPPDAKLANAEKQGTNDYGKLGYGGPCPPSGVHRYLFKVYALDRMLGLEAGLRKKDLLKAMEGHVLGMGTLTGKYKRK
jgi:Raf kinase inhibitor-like YbhB/YbcL family protein